MDHYGTAVQETALLNFLLSVVIRLNQILYIRIYSNHTDHILTGF